ncbi:unnamed protein product [Triticum turgidum subsp. durum]|uniref:BZIP domain-containing protein n=1 Tax=Triticum turgidum subsp. durum TaxID=4567 RepID=A0A9R1BMV6_TRITD|nr:unnamed protein product [Triticum turgidum subsp. durum]
MHDVIRRTGKSLPRKWQLTLVSPSVRKVPNYLCLLSLHNSCDRIWANRQSAARSKERKMRYISELERKVQTLHAEATTLSTQLALLHRDTAGLSTENSELKMRLQNVEQQIHLQDGKVSNSSYSLSFTFFVLPRM